MILNNFNSYVNDFYFIIPELFFITGICYIVFFFSINKNYSNFTNILHLNLLVVYFLFFTLYLYIHDIIYIHFSVFMFNYFFKKSIYFNFVSIFVIILSLIFLKVLILTMVKTSRFNYTFEYVILILFTILGLLLLFISNDLLVFYLGFELLSLSLYVLISFNSHSLSAVSSALKYYILGAISSSLMLLGIAFIYGLLGTTNYNDISYILHFVINDSSYNTIIIIPISLFFIALLFKLGSFPFHFWLAEIYGGISYKTLFFIIIIPKIGLIFLLLNFINNVFYEIFPLLHNVFLILGLICIYVGSFCGLAQRALKKLLAFSSIVNLGYILILFSTLSGFNLIFSIVYLISYFINLIILFILVILLNKFIGDKDFKITEINQLSNLFKTHPIFAITLAISIFSVAGLPPFGGFYSKYFIIVDLINNGLISVCLAILLLGSISTFYYIRIIKIIFFNNDLADKSDFYNKNQNSIITLNLQDDYIATYFLSFLVFCFLSINFIIILYPSLLFYPLFFLLLI